MFSGFKQAVESLAQPPRRSESIDESAKSNGVASPDINASPSTGHAPSNISWPGNPLSGASLPSIANLSKLPFAARSASPARSAVGSARVASPAPHDRELSAVSSRQRLTLEDRLKARFSIGDASPGETPEASGRNTPTPLPAQVISSPTSTPLPNSPMISPLEEVGASLSLDTELKQLQGDAIMEEAVEPSLAQISSEPMKEPMEDVTIPLNTHTVPETETPTTHEPSLSIDPLNMLVQPLDSSPAALHGNTDTDNSPVTSPSSEHVVNEDEAATSTPPAKQDAGLDTSSVSSITEASDDLSPPLPPPTALETVTDDSTPEASLAPVGDTPTSILDTEAPGSSLMETAASQPTETTPPSDSEASKRPHTSDDLSTSFEEVSENVTSENVDISKPERPLITKSEPSIPSEERIVETSVPDATSIPIVAELRAPSPLPPLTGTVDADSLQERLKLVELRFADVSASFKKLQADRLAADKVLQELTSLNTVNDAVALREYFESTKLKADMSQDEIKRLNGKLSRQEERLEELRDIHHMETKSQTELIDKLRQQAEDAEVNVKTHKASVAKAEEDAAKHKLQVERLQAELQKATRSAKDEQEKTGKAVTLLKTVRGKLIKTEKERDDAVKDAGAGRQKLQEELDKERAEKAQVLADVARVNAERDNALAGMKSHFDREIAGLKERQQRETAAIKAQFELEAMNARTSFVSELSAKDARVTALEKSVQSLNQEKSRLFEQLQMRQAEYESSQTELESMQGETTEINYQLREANDRIALLTDELAEAHRSRHVKSASSTPSADESARVLAITEAKYETRLAELRARVQSAEKDRNDGEAAWSRKLDEKTREVDDIRRQIDASAHIDQRHEAIVAQIRQENEELQAELRAQRKEMVDLQLRAQQAIEAESNVGSEIEEANTKANVLEKQLEEIRSRESQLKASNKTLREELRKVQSSVALFERQRAPGVGYWGASRTNSSNDVNGRTSMSSTDLPLSPDSPRLSAATLVPNEEEVNLEYIRNIILQFLEHPDMRANLVRVLSAILRFTPQETRRLIAKV